MLSKKLAETVLQLCTDLKSFIPCWFILKINPTLWYLCCQDGSTFEAINEKQHYSDTYYFVRYFCCSIGKLPCRSVDLSTRLPQLSCRSRLLYWDGSDCRAWSKREPWPRTPIERLQSRRNLPRWFSAGRCFCNQCDMPMWCSSIAVISQIWHSSLLCF